MRWNSFLRDLRHARLIIAATAGAGEGGSAAAVHHAAAAALHPSWAGGDSELDSLWRCM